jgi:hypothetical protein
MRINHCLACPFDKESKCQQDPYPFPLKDSTFATSFFTLLATRLLTGSASAFSNDPKGSAAELGSSKEGLFAADRSRAMFRDFWLTPPDSKSDSAIAHDLGAGTVGARLEMEEEDAAAFGAAPLEDAAAKDGPVQGCRIGES